MSEKTFLTTAFAGNFFPLSLTRKIEDFRLGILTIREKRELARASAWWPADLPAYSENEMAVISYPHIEWGKNSGQSLSLRTISYSWDLPSANADAIRTDFLLLTAQKESAPLPAHVQAINSENIFVEEGATLYPCIINAESGPVYLGKHSIIMEGATIRGPFALCEGAIVKMGAKIYGATTAGPFSVLGGEVKNSIFFDYSNKAHDGYIGDSVIGAWCNLGAGTSNSNLSNSAGPVKRWHEPQRSLIETGSIKSGLIMGDYSRSAINTSFNTGTTVGVCANIFGAGLSPRHIPSFSWGMDGERRYEFEKAIEHIRNWKKLKDKQLSAQELQQLKHIFDNH